jgi:hypothetical protein
MKVEREEIREACVIARHELAIDDEGAHAGQARESIDHPTDTA